MFGGSRTEWGAIPSDRRAEVSRGHSRGESLEGLNGAPARSGVNERRSRFVRNHGIASVKQRKLPLACPEDEAGVRSRGGHSGLSHEPAGAGVGAIQPNISSRDGSSPKGEWQEGPTNQPNRRVRDPYARWCGRRGSVRAPPIPIGRRNLPAPPAGGRSSTTNERFANSGSIATLHGLVGELGRAKDFAQEPVELGNPLRCVQDLSELTDESTHSLQIDTVSMQRE